MAMVSEMPATMMMTTMAFLTIRTVARIRRTLTQEMLIMMVSQTHATMMTTMTASLTQMTIVL
jgi:hypothetical protein